MLRKNESGIDRLVRLVAGGGLLIDALTTLGLASAKPLGILLGLVGVVLLFTAAVGSCPLYRVFGFNRARLRSQSPAPPRRSSRPAEGGSKGRQLVELPALLLARARVFTDPRSRVILVRT